MLDLAGRCPCCGGPAAADPNGGPAVVVRTTVCRLRKALQGTSMSIPVERRSTVGYRLAHAGEVRA